MRRTDDPSQIGGPLVKHVRTWPLFGEFVAQVARVPAADLEACLAAQRTNGGLLGQTLVDRGLLRGEQVDEVLAMQAAWVARSLGGDTRCCFPYPAYLSLCMPAYNEQQTIASTLRSALAVLPHFVELFEIVVVDDGSRDETALRVAETARHNPSVRLLRHENNRGYGAAVTTALRAAAGELVMFTDSDGQFNLLDAARLLVQLGEADLVIGYRKHRADDLQRRLNAWLWGWLVRCLLGFRVRDLDCAFKLFHRETIDALQLTAPGACINAE
ncbi:MAG TPA: glycosyltransferase, partial [Pirellulales bacterium]|nr:glycosyltransferase [Pirellulales bacterium]